jgi:hypothetical protein
MSWFHFEMLRVDLFDIGLINPRGVRRHSRRRD